LRGASTGLVNSVAPMWIEKAHPLAYYNTEMTLFAFAAYRSPIRKAEFRSFG